MSSLVQVASTEIPATQPDMEDWDDKWENDWWEASEDPQRENIQVLSSDAVLVFVCPGFMLQIDGSSARLNRRQNPTKKPSHGGVIVASRCKFIADVSLGC